MSALRYSGEIRIRVTYRDSDGETYSDGTFRHPNGFYRCILTCGNERAKIIVGAPAFLSHAVDSSEAYDDVARAAIAFADDESGVWGERASYAADGSDWHVGRTLADAHASPLVSVLSIDAWADSEPRTWNWNAWYSVGKAPASLASRSPREVLRFMRDAGYLSKESRGRVAVEDDQYNLVIVDKNTRMPLFAIAYGEADESLTSEGNAS